MGKYKAKKKKISVLIFRFLFFLVAMIVLPNINILSETIMTVWYYIIGAALVLLLIEIVYFFKKREDYISFTENGLKLETKWGVVQECKFTDIFKYNYRRQKLKSIVVLNDKNKAVLVALNRYEVELAELKKKIDERQESLGLDYK